MEFGLRNAQRRDAPQAAMLLHIAQGRASVPIHGLGSETAALAFYRRMFCKKSNTWSYDVTTVATDGERLIGLVSCYPTDQRRTFRRIKTLLDARFAYGLVSGSWRSLRYDERRGICADGFPDVDVEQALYIRNLAVLPEYRSKGVGKALLTAVDNHRQRLGYTACCLHVEDGNEEAIQFFQSHGFSVVADQQGFGCQLLCGFGGYLLMAK